MIDSKKSTFVESATGIFICIRILYTELNKTDNKSIFYHNGGMKFIKKSKTTS